MAAGAVLPREREPDRPRWLRYVALHAEAIAAWREEGGFGESDAFAASEMPSGRSYDVVVAISRLGTTTEVLRLIELLSSRTEVLAITGAESTPPSPKRPRQHLFALC